MVEFSEYICDAENRFMHSDERRGQAYFNSLEEAAPTLAEEIRGTYVDPFYNDELLVQFLHRVHTSWDWHVR